MPATGAASPRHWHGALAVVAAATCVKLTVAAIAPLDVDETYYWEWSRHLAAGYFDEPPAIAWIVRVGVALCGPTPLGVRLVSVLTGGIAALTLAALAGRLGGDRAALRAAMIVACLPLTGVVFAMAVPDNPSMAATALVITAVERALAAPCGSQRSLRWWLLAGLALGVALLSKYTAVLIPLGVLLAVLVRTTLRARLAEAGPYLACGLAILLFTPVMVWNGTHQWVSFRFQLQHGLGGAPASSPLTSELELLGGQMLVATPVLLVQIAVAAAIALRRSSERARFVLAVITIVVVAFFGVSAVRHRVEANWPAPAYVPAAVLLALEANRGSWNKWFRAGCALGGAFLMLLYTHASNPSFLPGVSFPLEAGDWPRVAERVAEVRGRLARSGSSTWLAANRYQDASELAFCLADHPTVFSLNIAARHNQYDVWPGFAQRARAGDALIVVVGEAEELPPLVVWLTPHFDRVQKGELVDLRPVGRTVLRRRIWVFDGWHGSWPVVPEFAYRTLGGGTASDGA